MTYAFVDHPDYQPAIYLGGTWHLSGTITTDGTLGDLSPLNIIGGTVTLDGPDGPYTGSIDSFSNGDYSYNLPLHAEPTYLSVPYGGATWFFLSGDVAGLDYTNHETIDAIGNHDSYAQDSGFTSNPRDPISGAGFELPWTTGEVFGVQPGGAWIIATFVPEPATLTLLGLALLVLGGMRLRHRIASTRVLATLVAAIAFWAVSLPGLAEQILVSRGAAGGTIGQYATSGAPLGGRFGLRENADANLNTVSTVLARDQWAPLGNASR